jgi:hypothetical protein
MNNIIDSIGKISKYDTLTIVMPLKPVWNKFNKRAQKIVEWLYKQDAKYMEEYEWTWSILWKIFKPLKKLLKLIFFWAPKEWEKNEFWYTKWWTTMVRMVKAQEDYLNSMWEETALPYFQAWLVIISTSDDETKPWWNIDNIVSSLSTYWDEYWNTLIDCSARADAFGSVYKPLWKFAVNHLLTNFFFKKNVFWINEITSLYHFPDNTYNRSPIISWMQYKILPWPDNLPILKDENWYVMSWQLAESFKWW